METISKIRRLYHVEKKGFKTIARELRLSRNTVKKVIKQQLIEQSYRRSHQPYRVLGDYKALLESKLKADHDEPRRRRRTNKKLYDELCEAGYDGTYEAVNNFVKQQKRLSDSWSPQGFVPLSFSPGEVFQFDWSEEEIELSGKLVRIKVAQIRLCHSRFFLQIAYPNEQLEMVMDAHDKAFAFFGGSCRKGIYDNMRTVVNRFENGKACEFNPRFSAMASHHLFEIVACTPRSGWEKGQVENQVALGRRHFFTPLVRVESLEALNKQLESQCLAWAKKAMHPEQKEKTVWSVYEAEKAQLLDHQGDFKGYKLKSTTVSSTSLVQWETNAYSVDCHYARKAIELHIFCDRIEAYYKDQCIGAHVRSFERHQKIYEPWHYVPLLERKPGALRHGAPFKDWELPVPLKRVRQALERHADGHKQFIEILLQVQVFGLGAVKAACSQAIEQGLSQSKIILSYLTPHVREKEDTRDLSPLKLLTPPHADCLVYNQLCQPATVLWGQEVKYAA